jgi:DNA-binding LytR/AlgR family response regulator
MSKSGEDKMLKCLIIDDEPLAIKLLEEYIGRLPFLQWTGSSTKPLDTLLELPQKPTDLIFLDIQMPQLNGVAFMKLLQNRARVIITSAYQEYAFEGFEHDVIDYLLKPISFERFYKASEKAYRLKYPLENPKAAVDFHPATGGYIFVKVENRMVRVELDEILYIEGLKNYLSIYTKTERIVALQAMKQMEDALPPNRFVRVHKSYIVALDKVNSVEKQQIFIRDMVIPIGNTHADLFFKVLNDRKI